MKKTKARYAFTYCDYKKMTAEGREMLRRLVNAAGDRMTKEREARTAKEKR